MHLTEHIRFDTEADIVTEVSAGASEHEIEVTPEMVGAGRDALFDAWDGYPDFPGSDRAINKIIKAVYVSMVTHKPCGA
jgi:hypothetical protein